GLPVQRRQPAAPGRAAAALSRPAARGVLLAAKARQSRPAPCPAGQPEPPDYAGRRRGFTGQPCRRNLGSTRLACLFRTLQRRRGVHLRQQFYRAYSRRAATRPPGTGHANPGQWLLLRLAEVITAPDKGASNN